MASNYDLYQLGILWYFTLWTFRYIHCSHENFIRITWVWVWLCYPASLCYGSYQSKQLFQKKWILTTLATPWVALRKIICRNSIYSHMASNYWKCFLIVHDGCRWILRKPEMRFSTTDIRPETGCVKSLENTRKTDTFFAAPNSLIFLERKWRIQAVFVLLKGSFGTPSNVAEASYNNALTPGFLTGPFFVLLIFYWWKFISSA